MTTITVDLPLPPMALSKNARVHWRIRHHAFAEHRRWAEAAWLCAKFGGGIQADGAWEGTVYMDVVWRFAGPQPDPSNAWERTQAYLDGAQLARVVWDDRSVHYGTMEFQRVKRDEQGCTITLRRAA